MGKKTALAIVVAITAAALAFVTLGSNAFADTGGPGVAKPGFAIQSR
jgi:hypothetical protein